MVNNIIETFDLTKIYKLKGKEKEIKALNNINISVKEGEIFGLLGPNGAGKTTAIQILTTLTSPTSGRVLIDGYDVIKNPRRAKNNIALMLGSKMLYNRISAYDNLKFFCKIYKVVNYDNKIKDITKDFGLEKWLYQYVENFSTGMKMKLALCRTFLLNRRVLFLDEPTSGLDVEAVSYIVEKIKESKATIFLTSHDMNVVEKLCKRISFLNKGNIIKIGTKDDIRKFFQTEIYVEIEILNNNIQLKNELIQQDFVNKIVNTDRGFIISLKSRNKYKDLLQILGKYEILMVKEKRLSLEDLFLKIINN